jgi:hypothetical protein
MKHSIIDYPTNIIHKFIKHYLKPKETEKKKFGEVFTPMELVYEMLDKLDCYYFKEHNNSIFEKKHFDPANGMRNFMIAV